MMNKKAIETEISSLTRIDKMFSEEKARIENLLGKVCDLINVTQQAKYDLMNRGNGSLTEEEFFHNEAKRLTYLDETDVVLGLNKKLNEIKFSLRLNSVNK